MSLGTVDPENNPTVCTVFYAVDNDLSLYFVSEPESGHVENIFVNSYVACAVSDSDQSVSDKKIGIQITGRAEKIAGIDSLRRALDLWNHANPGIESVINFKSITRKIISSAVFRIKPDKIKFFNEKLFGDEGVGSINFD